MSNEHQMSEEVKAVDPERFRKPAPVIELTPEVLANLQRLLDDVQKIASVTGLPWHREPSGGKPVLCANKETKGCCIAYGTIGSWKEIDLAVAAVNALPALLKTAIAAARTPASCSPDVEELCDWLRNEGRARNRHKGDNAPKHKCEQAADALESMMRRVDAMRWQPIEALAMPAPDGPIQFVVLWNGQNVTVGVRRSEDSFEDALWIDRDGDMNPIVPPPTHWMPLPEPPRAGIEEK